MLTRTDIQSFPKTELHCHLDGSIRPATLQQIALAQGMPIASDLTEVEGKMRAPETCQNLEEYLQCFDFVLPYLQTEIALEMAAFDVMEQAVQDGIRYIEIRFAPSLSLNKGLTVIQTVESVLKGIAKAEAMYPITGNVLIIGMRYDEQEIIKHVFSEATSIGHEKIVGIDLAGPEEDYFVEPLAESFQFVVEGQNIHLTLHAGECGCVQNVLHAVEKGAKRIGHGTALKQDLKAQQVCIEKKVCIEGCPTSNIQTKAISTLSDYPLREWLDNGLAFCMNTDNKTVSNITLTEEYWKLVGEFNLTKEEFERLNTHGINHSFASKEIKERVLSEMKTFNL